MKHFKKIIKQYVSDFYIHKIKRKPGATNFKWNQAIIYNYLKNKRNNKSFSSSLIQDLNKLDSNDQTALMWVFDNVHNSVNKSMLFELLDCPEIDVNQQNSNGDTVLNKACKNNTTFIHTLLNQKDINSTISNKDGEYPLKIACKYDLTVRNNQKVIHELLKHQNDNFNILEQDGDVALILAFKTKSFDSSIVNKMAKHPQIKVSSWNDNGYKTIKWEYENKAEDTNKIFDQVIIKLTDQMTEKSDWANITISFYRNTKQNFLPINIDTINIETNHQNEYKSFQNIFQYTQLRQKLATQDADKNSDKFSQENEKPEHHRKNKIPL